MYAVILSSRHTCTATNSGVRASESESQTLVVGCYDANSSYLFGTQATAAAAAVTVAAAAVVAEAEAADAELVEAEAGEAEAVEEEADAMSAVAAAAAGAGAASAARWAGAKVKKLELVVFGLKMLKNT